MNYSVVLLLLLPGFGINVRYKLLSFLIIIIIIIGFIIKHDKIILLIITWSDHPRQQSYHKGGMGRP
jgi:hypothetical protein